MKDLNDFYLAEVQRLEDDWRRSMAAITDMLEDTLEKLGAPHDRIKLHDFKLYTPYEPWRKVYFVNIDREHLSVLEVGLHHDPTYNGDDDNEDADDTDCLDEECTADITVEQQLSLLRELQDPANWCFVDAEGNEVAAIA